MKLIILSIGFPQSNSTSTGLTPEMQLLNLDEKRKNDEKVNKKRKRNQVIKADETSIEQKLIQSMVERDIMENDFQCNNMDEYIMTLKKLEEVIKTCGKHTLFYHTEKGRILKLMKKENDNFREILIEKNIKYSLSHINDLIKVSDLITKHSTLSKCSVSFYFIKTNFICIIKLANKNKW